MFHKLHEDEPKFAIVGPLNFASKFVDLKFVTCSSKILFYFLIGNRNEFKKNKERLRTANIFGHKTLALSLFRGFKKLNIPFVYNKITKTTKNVIVLWADMSDVKKLEALKNKGKIQKVVTVPTACKQDYQYMSRQFARESCIDKCLVASEWVKTEYKQSLEPQYWEKVEAWSSGVELPTNIDVSSEEKIDCICYFKQVTCDVELLSLLDKLNVTHKEFYYSDKMTYRFSDWQKALREANFVIFCQDIIETQGLSMSEAWAHNRPTLVKFSSNQYGGVTSPYMSEQAGLFYNNLEDLEKILIEYKNSGDLFLNRFSPRKYVEENFSDEISVRKLIEIFDSIK